MRVIATKVSDDVYEMLKRKAEDMGYSISELLRTLVYDYLKVDKGKPRFTSSLPLQYEIEELKTRVKALEQIVYKGKPMVDQGKPRSKTLTTQGKSKSLHEFIGEDEIEKAIDRIVGDKSGESE